MEVWEFKVAISALIALVSGVLGFVVKGALEKRREIESRAFERKEERYKVILGLLIGLYREKGEPNLLSIKKQLLQETDFAWLYASPMVVRALNEFFDSITKNAGVDSSDKMKRLFNVIKAMRVDLGLKGNLHFEDWQPRDPE